MDATQFNLADTLALLVRTPDSLNALLAGTSDRWARATEGSGTWSPYDVIGHLIHGERTDWLPRVRHIMAGETGPFEPFDRTGMFHEPQDLPLDQLLANFAAARRENLAELATLGLTEADLERPGLHPELGAVNMWQLLATWVVHDLDHIAQIARTMAKVYEEAVGPWSEYLMILRARG